MRLINVKTLKLESFARKRPPYAILSHTWKAGQEVTFQMLQGSDLKYRKLSGWNKIQQCCKQARDYGWDYVWVDTCCIDKTNSAELDEAISSMFAWYGEAAVCFAYLVDHHSIGYDISGCRWFTRGWTLQELLAPWSVIFFNSGWKEIGTRDSLSSIISRATNIGVDYLTRRDLFRNASVSERFYWASQRKTERIEDEAYCLLGLFDIHMPLIYGEREKAFERLQEAILEVHDDETMFAWLFTNKNALNVRGGKSGFLAQRPSQFKDCGGLVPVIYDESRTGVLFWSQGLCMHARLRRITRKLSYDEVLVFNIAHVSNGSIPRYLLRIQKDSVVHGSRAVKAVSPTYDPSGLEANCPLRALYKAVPALSLNGSSGPGRVALSDPAKLYCYIPSIIPRPPKTTKVPVSLFITAHGIAVPSSVLVFNGPSGGDSAVDLQSHQAKGAITCGNVCLSGEADRYMFLVTRLQMINGEKLNVAIGLHWKGLSDIPSATLWPSKPEDSKKNSFQRLKKDLAMAPAMNPSLCFRGLQINLRAYPIPDTTGTSETSLRVQLVIN